jgi:transposase
MTLEAALHALSDAETRIQDAENRVHALEAERTCLTLRVKDLEQQLVARSASRALVADPALLSFFQDPDHPAPTDPVVSRAAPEAVRARARAPRESAPRPRGRQPLDPALPREVIRLPDPPAAARVDVFTGAPLTPGFTETLEVLARRPAVYFVKHYERTVWVSPDKTAPVAMPWPPSALPRSRIDASVVAHIAAAHFSEHVPYYRLEQQLARAGVSLPRNTQVSLMAQLDARVTPVVDCLKRHVLASGYVHLDATPIDVCDPTRPGEARSATVWAYRARSPDPEQDGLVWFDYRATKSPVEPSAVLRAAQYRGVVQTDGAAGLDALAPPEQITHLGCWAHYLERCFMRSGGRIVDCHRGERLASRLRIISAVAPRFTDAQRRTAADPTADAVECRGVHQQSRVA